MELAKDRIPNIRLAVGRLLSLLFSYHPHLLTQLNRKWIDMDMEFVFKEFNSKFFFFILLADPMMETLILLQCDEDNDVKFVANDR